MHNQTLKNKLMQEIEALPEDKIGEFHDIVHYFRLGLGLEGEEEDIGKKAGEFFTIWKDITPEEDSVLEEIKLRREQTLQERSP